MSISPIARTAPARPGPAVVTPTSRPAPLSITCLNAMQAGPFGMTGFLARRLLNYLSRTEHDRYLKLIADLGLRR